MQPGKLTLKNFGPFINETVDFTDFQTGGLFLVSGKTGAGKTTLFDGMTFALFGETSGRTRRGDEMRSMFASPEEETMVSFTFEHQNLTYQIERRPKQVLAKKRGTGTREQPAKVQLTVFDGKKELKQFSKEGEVKQEIEELLHLDAKQFFQIIMLPQGEFRNFLIASSDEKEAVLRRLFGTELYQRLNEILTEKRKNYQAAIDALENEQLSLQKRFRWRGVEVTAASTAETLINWQSEITDTQQEIAELMEKSAQAETKRQEAEQTFYEARELSRAFAEVEALQKRRANLVQREGEMQAKKNQLQKLQWAKEQQAQVAAVERGKKQLLQVEEQLQEQAVRQQKNQEVLREWQKQRDFFDDLAQNVTKDQNQLRQKEELLPRVKDYRIVMAQQEAREKEMQATTELLTALVANKKQLTKQIGTQTALLQKRSTFQSEQLLLAKAQQKAEKWQESQLTVTELNNEERQNKLQLEELQRQLRDNNARGELLQQQLLALKARYAEIMIAKLSRDLKPGQPCPVCGSTQHPKIAELANEAVDLAEVDHALNDCEVEFQQNETQKATLQERAARFQKRIEEILQQRQTKLEKVEEVLTAFQKLVPESLAADDIDPSQLIQQWTQELQEKAASFQTAEERLEKLNEELTQLDSEIAVNDQTLQQLTNQKQLHAGKLLALNEGFGENDPDRIPEQIEELQETIRQNNEKILADRKLGQQLQTDALLLAEQAKQLTKQKHTLQEDLTINETKLQQVVEDSQWINHLTELQTLLAELSLIDELLPVIGEYEKEQQVVAERLLEVNALIKEQEPPQLLVLEENYQAAQAVLDQLKSDLISVKERQRQNQKLQSELEELYQKNQQQLEEATQLSELAQTIAGNNPQNISLERYVLQAYLSEVLEVANQRLQRLTRGRYQFELSETGGTGRKNTGLEINIYDDHAGATRRAHTLSGGESFIAALSLALSLADVIQNRSGGIAIEALFIDEGFGSLDEDSLEMALEALGIIENEGRLIGIISHVQALKECIVQQVLVLTNGNGQSTITVKK